MCDLTFLVGKQQKINGTPSESVERREQNVRAGHQDKSRGGDPLGTTPGLKSCQRACYNFGASVNLHLVFSGGIDISTETECIVVPGEVTPCWCNRVVHSLCRILSTPVRLIVMFITTHKIKTKLNQIITS